MGAVRLLFEASHELETNEMPFLLLISSCFTFSFLFDVSCIIEDVGGEKFELRCLFFLFAGNDVCYMH